jgi:IS4 transposase
VLEGGAELVLRLHPKSFPLEDHAGAPIHLLNWCRQVNRQRPIERFVWFQHNRKRYRLRLCALRKSQTATERARKKQRGKASRMGRQLDPESVALAEYVLVVTSLPAKVWPTARVLKLYRYRWQVELVFKRLKSLLGLGHLPKTNDHSARSWLQAKILTALLVERAMHEARFFSPWGYALESEPLGAVPRNA